MNETADITCTFVGDGYVGKTSLLRQFSRNLFDDHYNATVFDVETATVTHEGRKVKLKLQDTAGQVDYDRIRPLSYPVTDVFVICFSMVDRNSFENVSLRWYSEVKHYSPQKPIILVGTKCDMIDSGEDFIGSEECRRKAKEIDAGAFVECSSMTKYGVTEVFNNVAIVFFTSKTKKRKKTCTVL